MARGRRFEETFKIETVKYISENNKPVAQVAREVGVEREYFTWLGKEVWPTTGDKGCKILSLRSSRIKSSPEGNS